MKKLLIQIIIWLPLNSFAQNSGAISFLISEVKKSVYPIACHDTTLKNNYTQYGTCIPLGNAKYVCFLTCEHVVATKDSITNKTVRYCSNLQVQINDKNDSVSQWIQLDLIYADEKSDFAILKINEHQDVTHLSFLQKIQPSLWKDTKELKEGETVLYVGYPMSLGIDNVNHPLSRTGMISQLVKGKNSFLIDGFVQHGHSGSPVFLLSPRPASSEGWDFYLIGIATSFPDEYSKVFEKVKLKESPTTVALINPGFTYVTSMNEIIPVLNKLGIK